VAAGRFRQDLYYRLNVHQLVVPPLRERRSDVPEIAERFAAAISARFGLRPKRLAPEALDLLMGYDWARNNVRDLRNVIERMIIATDGEVIGPDQVPPEIRGEAAPPAAGGETFRELKAEAERRIVITRSSGTSGTSPAPRRRSGWPIMPASQDHAAAQHQAAVTNSATAAVSGGRATLRSTPWTSRDRSRSTSRSAGYAAPAGTA
jgi:DNA-binding NtrC family response regulator